MSETANEHVNPHYLDRVVSLSNHAPILASEDIYSANGAKLLAKGARISHETQERLILHKLRRPLEVSLVVSDSITPDWLAQAADRVIEEAPELRPLFGLTDLTRWIDEIQLNGATHGLISVAAGQEACGLQHSMRVALAALAIGFHLKLPEKDMQILAMAGLLHDIGELYIDPLHINRRNALTLEGWRHVSAHPLIGYRIASDICGIHPTAAQAIQEHHERGDGSGYPRSLHAPDMSRAGQILGVAELVASISDVTDHPLERADLALRLVAGEFPSDIIGVINRRAVRKGTPPASGHADAEMHALFKRIARTVALIDAFQDDMRHHAEEDRLLARVAERFQHIQRAFSSSGLDVCSMDDDLQKLIAGAPEWLHFEADLIMHEIRWRLRDLARDLALRASLLSAATDALFHPLVDALQGEDEVHGPLPER